MKALVMTAAILFASTAYATADEGRRCGPTGQFYGYGFRAHALPCWVLEAFGQTSGPADAPAE